MEKPRLFEEAENNQDATFLAKIINEICEYAVTNGMEPDDTLDTIAENIKLIRQISTFNRYKII